MKNRLVSIGTVGLVLFLLTGLRPGFGPAAAQHGQAAKESEALAVPAALLGTAFTYQGWLTEGPRTVDDTCTFTFDLYDEAGSGTPPAGGSLLGTVTASNVEVRSGLFTVQLDFGPEAFAGDGRWLEIAVDCGDGAGTLSPRQALRPAPYALALPGLWIQQNSTSPNLVGGYAQNQMDSAVMGGTISGGGSSTDPNRLGGDYATVGGGAGNTADGQDATVGGGRLNAASGPSATVAGGLGNEAAAKLAAIAGGGRTDAANPDTGNRVHDDYGTIGGGGDNEAGNNDGNPANSPHATVSGGKGNAASGEFATVGGGTANTAAPYATVGGGKQNSASDQSSTIGGGESNIAYRLATVSGGQRNFAGGNLATVGGGANNSATGQYATVPGGSYNEAAADYALAAGRRAKAQQPGCFVWGDHTNADIVCAEEDQWVARASGGVCFYTSSDLSTGACLEAGESTWQPAAMSSNRHLKENVVDVDYLAILEQLVAAVPVTTWNYRSQDGAVSHMGPMAQDFYTAFGLGADDEQISTIDANGVALAAIHGLYTLNQAMQTENGQLRMQVQDLEARLATLEALVAQLAGGSPGGGR